MSIEFGFRITPEEVSVSDAGTGFAKVFPNRIAVLASRGTFLAFGETDTQVKARLGAWYEEHADRVEFLTLFGPDGTHLEYEIRVLEHLTRILHGQSQDARRMAHLARKLAHDFDYVLEIPGYETFPAGRRAALEQTMQAHLRLRRLKINGREVQISVRRREAEFWLRVLFGWVTVAATAVAYLTAPRAVEQSGLFLFAYLAGVAVASHLGGRVLWMLAARRLLPPTYRLCMLQGRRERISRIDRALVRAFWAPGS